MTKKRGRPPKSADESRDAYLDVRLESTEKAAFDHAAKLAGLSLSSWVRERLRQISRKELEGAGYPVAFLTKHVEDKPTP